MRIAFVPAALIAASLATQPASAGGLTHTGDIILNTDSGSIVTNAFVSGAAQPQRVFDSVMGELVPGITDEPGFDCLPGTFPTGSSLRFDILDALREWDGENFDTISGQTVGISFLSLGPVVTPATADTTVQGFNIPVQSGGVWHRHLTYALNFGAPSGVYLLKMQLVSSSASIAESEPFWLVFDNDANAVDFAEAVAWAQNNLGIDPVACPGDTNGDNIVNFTDLNTVLAAFGESGDGLAGDVNGDGVVNFTDLNEVLANFGADCG